MCKINGSDQSTCMRGLYDRTLSNNHPEELTEEVCVMYVMNLLDDPVALRHVMAEVEPGP